MERPEPTPKSIKIEDALKSILGVDRRETINALKCVPTPIGCGRQITMEEFNSEFEPIEQKEYAISSLCNRCQQEIFKEPDE